MTTYWFAPEVEEIAEKLIAEHHTELAGVTIKYLFRDKVARNKGQAVLAKARKIGGLNAYLVRMVGRKRVDGEVEFFVIEVGNDAWVLMNAAQKEALIDHELCHLGVTDDNKLTTYGHDLEEFVEVVQRHGMWAAPIKALVDAAGQTTIDDALADAEEVDHG